MSRKRELSDDERILWNLVARSTRPLPGRKLSEVEPAPEAKPAVASLEPKAQPVRQAVGPVAAKLQVQHIDKHTQKKIARGKLVLEARIDLHGLRQDAAYGMLLSFLSSAHVRGVRYVLVITGKGSSSASDGVLKRSVPGWLATQPFRQYVSGYEDAALTHGGQGALYVRMRRLPRETSP
jgi:DNA-nicking Smr family endonuclease